MSGFVIQYTDIYNMLWAYQSRLENFMEMTKQCQKSITTLIENPRFQGAAATAIKSYLNDNRNSSAHAIRKPASMMLFRRVAAKFAHKMAFRS